MRLVKLEIHQLPGINPGFVFEGLGPGVNLVTGPNGVGKSSLIRAFRHLVAGVQSTDPVALSLTAEFETDGKRWVVRRTGRDIAWEADGRPAEAPPLPDADELTCYLLEMELLVKAERADEQFSSEVRRQLRGGYDLDAPKSLPLFKLKRNQGKNEAKRLAEAWRKLRQVEAEREQLRRDEERIPKLEEEIDAAKKAAKRRDELTKAIALYEAQQERQNIEAALASYPPDMNRLNGDEPQQLQKLEERRDQLQQELKTQRDRLHQAQQELSDTGLAEKCPSSVELETLQSKLQNAKTRQVKLDERISDRTKAEARLKTALERLGAKVETLPRLSPEEISEAEMPARDLYRAEQRKAELEARVEDQIERPAEEEIERLYGAAEALRDWLAAESTVPRRLRWAIGLAVAGTALAAIGSLWDGAWMALPGLGIVTAGLIWAWLLYRESGSRSARRRFEQTGTQPPRDWSTVSVRTRLKELEEERRRVLEQRAKAERVAEARREIQQLEQELAKLHRARKELAERLGFDPQLTALGLAEFLNLVKEFHTAKREREEAEEQIKAIKQEIEKVADEAYEFLTDWGERPTDRSIEALEAALQSLSKRVVEAEDAKREITHAQQQIDRIKNDLHDLDEQERALYEHAGVPVGDLAELRDRCELLKSWKDQRKKLTEAKAVEAERQRPIEANMELLQRVEAGDREWLENEYKKAVEQASKLESLHSELQNIRTRLEVAGSDFKLEGAAAEVQKARDQLEDALDRALFAEAARFLLDAVEDEYQSEHVPEVLREAREHFRQFTHHKYDLIVGLEADSDGSGLAAIESDTGQRRSLQELSTGTRMQLLLAVRMAWLKRLESRRGIRPLPVFLDEALTVSDEDRFGIVARTIEQWSAEEDRQFFYLSARRHEVALWERSTGRKPHHVDLAKLRFGDEAPGPDYFKLPEDEPLPEPGTLSAEEYAALISVPPLDPRADAGALHLFYLLRDDLDTLYHLMEEWRIGTLGQLEMLLSSEASPKAIADPAYRRRLGARCRAARTWFLVWRRGRGKPVDRIALEQSGAVSGSFIDEVTELAAQLGGDARQLIAKLRERAVRRFRNDKTDQLERWLRDNGYLDDAEPFDRSARERQTLLEAGSDQDNEQVRLVVRWLEAAWSARAGDTGPKR